MIQHLPEIQKTVQGLGVLVGTQRPFARFLVKNWPLALIAGFAMYGRCRERYQKGELNVYNGMADVGLILSPLVGLALLNQLATEDKQRADQEALAVAAGQAQTAAQQGQ